MGKKNVNFNFFRVLLPRVKTKKSAKHRLLKRENSNFFFLPAICETRAAAACLALQGLLRTGLSCRCPRPPIPGHLSGKAHCGGLDITAGQRMSQAPLWRLRRPPEAAAQSYWLARARTKAGALCSTLTEASPGAEGGAERGCAFPEVAFPLRAPGQARGPAAPHPHPGPNRAHWTPSKWDSRDKESQGPTLPAPDPRPPPV